MSRGAVALSENGLTRTDVGGLAAADARPDAGGVPILLVPGYTGSKEDFGPLLPLLAPYRAVAVDLPGQYQSPRLPAYTWDALVDAVLAVVDALGGRVHLVGHSFGGLVSARAVLARPSAFASLTLMDSGPGLLGGKRAKDTALLLPALTAMPMEALFDGLVAGGFATDTGISRAKWVGTDGLQMAQTGALLVAADDVTDELAASGVPCHVLLGENDNAWSPAVQQEMARRLGTEAVLIPGAVHSPAIEQPEATASALLALLASTPARV